ncbi:SCO family protein [Sphingobacterium sp. LRF_L2]|uniref:SCO family protein n=1 Tax=Sphingobacterium sp. LRF_L2 TaxID=3369421 RepID=UPI003F614974
MSNRTQRSKSKVIILALILLLPGFLYIAVNRFGANEYVSLPVFGEKKLSGEMKRNWGREYPDTIFHMAPLLEVDDYDSGKLSFPKSDTSVSVVHLFYTKDLSFSRLMLDQIQLLAQRFQSNSRIQFYSISVDPNDTKTDLATFVAPYEKQKSSYWHIVSHPSENIFAYAKNSLLIDAMVDPADSSRFLIGSQFVLLDSKRRIRGFYDVSQKDEVDRLEDEIKLLMVEEIRNRPMKVEKK